MAVVALEWIGAVLGLLGANVAMTGFALSIGAHGLLVQQLGFTATTLLGLHRSGLWARTRAA